MTDLEQIKDVLVNNYGDEGNTIFNNEEFMFIEAYELDELGRNYIDIFGWDSDIFQSYLNFESFNEFLKSQDSSITDDEELSEAYAYTIEDIEENDKYEQYSSFFDFEEFGRDLDERLIKLKDGYLEVYV